LVQLNSVNSLPVFIGMALAVQEPWHINEYPRLTGDHSPDKSSDYDFFA